MKNKKSCLIFSRATAASSTAFITRKLIPALALCSTLLWCDSASADTVTYNSEGTVNWTCPPGVTEITVECWGGGGAGGGSFVDGGSVNAGGGAGGGGAYARLDVVPVTAGASYVVTIPAAATCPASGFANNDRFNGSAVTFIGDAATTVTADGGEGGQCRIVTNATASTGGRGAGGVAGIGFDAAWSGGTSTNWSGGNASGGAGGAGDQGDGGGAIASNGSFGAGGSGSDANHTGGNGGAAKNGAGTGNAGSGPGGGGGGAKSTVASPGSKAGGKGGLGKIILTYTVPPNPKANNIDDLNVGTSWTLGGVPTGSLAEWNNIVTGPNATNLGGDQTFSGIRISDPGGAVTINAGNTLTLGAEAVDIDLSTANQDLTINCDLAMGAANVWDVAIGHTLTLGGGVSGSASVTKQGAGTVILSGATTYAGATSISEGTMQLTGNRTELVTGTVDIAGTNPILQISGDLPLGTSQLRPGNANGSGTVNQTAGAVTFTGGNQLTCGTNAATQGFYNLSGGTFTTASQSNRGVLIGVNSGCVGTFTLSGTGILDVVSGSVMDVGRSESSAAAIGATGVFNQTGGTATVSNLRVGGSSATNHANQTATLDLSGGTFAATAFTWLSGGDSSVSTINISGTADVTLAEFPTTRGAGATATLTFDGGTLSPAAASTTYMGGLDSAKIKAGGATFNVASGNDITITQDLLTDDLSLGGGLTKTGDGALTLSGNNTYTGPTLVSAGKLEVLSTQTGVGAATVSANATLGVTASGSSQWQPASLTLTDPCTLEFSSVRNPGTTTAPLLPTAPVGTVSNVTININSISGGGTPTYSYPLLGNEGGTTTGYTLGTEPAGVTGHLDVDGTTLVYVVDASADLWTGTDGTNPTFWDIGTSVNWDGNAQLNSPARSYADNDNVIFDDTAATSLVSIEAAVAPASVIFDNSSLNYTVGSSNGNGIGGSGGLIKEGSGIVTLNNANSYTGTTTLSAGTLSLGNVAALSGTTSVTLDDGTLLRSTLDGAVINAPITLGAGGTNATISAPTNAAGGGVVSALTLNGAIGGAGDVTFLSSVSQNALSTVYLGAQSTYAGSTLLNTTASTDGTTTSGENQIVVKLGIDNALPPTTVVTIDAGNGSGTGRYADLNLNGFNQQLAGLTNITRSGAKAVLRRQRVVNSDAAAAATLTINNSSDYTYSGYLGGSGGSVSGGSTPGSTNGDNFSLVKAGSGTFTLGVNDSAGGLSYAGDTTVTQGILNLGRTNPGNDLSTVTIASGAKLTLDFAGTDTVDKLFTGATQQGVGEYGHTDSGATNGGLGVGALDAYFEPGTGTLTVTTGPSGGYAAWTAGPFLGTLSNTDPAVDFDYGGLDTGVEWVVAGDPTDGSDDASVTPVLDNTTDPDFLIFTYRRSDAALADTNTAIGVEYGTDLSGWTTAVAGPDIDINATDDGASVGVDLVEVKIRRSAFAVGGKLFARLNVVVTP